MRVKKLEFRGRRDRGLGLYGTKSVETLLDHHVDY